MTRRDIITDFIIFPTVVLLLICVCVIDNLENVEAKDNNTTITSETSEECYCNISEE